MSRAASIVEINGTAYDAATGNVVGAVKKVASQVADQSKVIDGFVRKSSASLVKTTSAPRAKRSARSPKPAKQIHNRTERSHALMRNVVTKPKSHVLTAKKNLIKPSVSKAASQKHERRALAHAITRDERVKRFGIPKTAQVTQTKSRPAIVAKARPLAASPATPAPLPSMVVSTSHHKLERLLDEALLRADAHKRMMKRRSRNPLNWLNAPTKWLTIVIVALVLVVLTALVIWREVPQVSVKVAGLRAQVGASLPAYTPTGFAIAGPVSASGNVVTVNYQNKFSGSVNYDITQQTSIWDSASLAANVLGPRSQTQTSQVQGTTVYIYGKSNDATWVSGGVWYTLHNHASLASDQILQIVQSF